MLSLLFASQLPFPHVVFLLFPFCSSITAARQIFWLSWGGNFTEFIFYQISLFSHITNGKIISRFQREKNNVAKNDKNGMKEMNEICFYFLSLSIAQHSVNLKTRNGENLIQSSRELATHIHTNDFITWNEMFMIMLRASTSTSSHSAFILKEEKKIFSARSHFLFVTAQDFPPPPPSSFFQDQKWK